MTRHASKAAARQQPAGRAAPASDEAAGGRAARVAELRAQVRRGLYRPDVRSLARSLVDLVMGEP